LTRDARLSQHGSSCTTNPLIPFSSYSIWRDPEEALPKKSALKADPTAAARSSIRRRPSVHGRNRRLARDSSFVPPRIARSPPHVPAPAANSVRYSRRNGVPPIQSLLEHADRSLLPPPPPPVPLSRNYSNLERRERDLRNSLALLHAQAASLRRDAQTFVQSTGDHENDPWTETERRTLLQTAAAAQSRRPRLHRSRTRSVQPIDSRESSETQGVEGVRQFSLGPNILLTDGSAEPVIAILPRTLLPTPPLDHSEPDGDSLFAEGRLAASRPLHPLSRSWRADSPVNGLGDRNRSPTPTDIAWEMMETTIPEDTTVVSAESSFATVPATDSFASSTETTITEPERESASGSSERQSTEDRGEDNEDSDGGSASSVDIDCTDEEYMAQAESLAREMYFEELTSIDGRARIANIRNPDPSVTLIDMGFRLIDNALNTEEGRARVASLSGEDAVHRMVRFRDPAQRQNQTHARSPPYHPHSPPATSQDPPSANPVSPPSHRSAREAHDILINLEDGDEQQDLDTMRRVARRLATREEVPDDWWASMGLRLNPSIARPRQQRRRAHSPDGVRRADMHAERAIGRTRGGRVERGDARL
jgi:hypothetical protein